MTTRASHCGERRMANDDDARARAPPHAVGAIVRGVARARARVRGVRARRRRRRGPRRARAPGRLRRRRDVLARRRRRERDARARVLLPGRLAGVGEGDELPGGREEAGDVEDGARRERRGPGDGGGFGSHGGEGAGKTGKARRRSTGGRGGRRGRGGEVRGGGAAGDRRFIPSCTRCTEARLAR